MTNRVWSHLKMHYFSLGMRLFHDAVNFSELENDLEDMEIYGEEEDSGNEGDAVIATFQPLRDDAFASFNVHKGILIISIL